MALVAWAGLAIQLDASIGLTGSAGAAIWAMLRYFTVLTNLLVALQMGAIAAGWRAAWAPRPLGGLTLAIMLVGIVYGLLLNGLVELSGGAQIANLLLHRVTPLLVPIFWLFMAPHGGLSARDPWRWTLYPALYLAYALVRGQAEGIYAYPFINLARLGWGGVIANAAMISAGFVAAGHALVWIDRRLARRRR